MRIGISCYPTYGGSGVVASELALRLVDLGHQVHVLSYELPARLKSSALEQDREDLQPSPEPGLYFHRVDVRQYPLFEYPPYSLALANEMVQVARRFELDVLHVHYAVPNAVSALLAQQILQPQRLPVVTTLHGTDITLVGNDPSYLETTRWSIEQSDVVTAVSPWLEQETRTQFGTADRPLARHIEVIPNFVEASRFQKCRPSLGSEALSSEATDDESKAEPTLVHVSNFRGIKRTDVVVEAFAALRAHRPCRLRMVGEGPQREAAVELAEKLGVNHAVTWIGNDPNIEKALDGCALFLLPSRLESFGLAALEAMAAGVPVVCTAVGGLVDVVEDGVTGALVPESESLPEALAAACLAILDSPRRWQSMSEKARADALERFSVQSVLDRYVAVYRSVAGHR